MATLYEGLLAFKDLYDNAVSGDSKRDVSRYDRDWQTINNEMDCYYNALATGDSTAASGHLDNIVAILNGYDLTVDLPIPLPISFSVFSSPSTIQVPVDVNGLNPDYTNALSVISVYIGGVDDSSNWVFTITSVSNVTAVIQNGNEVKINDLTANTGYVYVDLLKDGYSNVSFFITVNRGYAGVDGEGWTGGSYDSGDGTVTFTSDDGLGFQTGDLRGADGVSGGTTQESNYSIHPMAVDGSIGVVALGNYSVDLQSARSDASEAAIGNYSYIGGGIGNANDGLYGVVGGGLSNEINNPGYESNTIGGGNINSITGTAARSTIPGGVNNNISEQLCSAIGSHNTLSNEASSAIGVGGESTTNGELIQSFSDSPVQKSTFMLEGTTASTSPTTLESLGRANFFGATPQSIQVASNTMLAGVVTLVGSETGVGQFMLRRTILLECDGAGNVTIPSSQTLGTDSGGSSGSLSYVLTTPNQLEVQVTAGRTAPTKWACMFEVVIQDL